MIEILVEMFSYPFLVRAMVVGLLVSLCCAMLGVSLVLKRYSMIGDGLSNVGFGALAVASVLNVAPLSFAIPVVVAAAFFLLRMNENSLIKGDAAIALVSTGSLSIGVLVMSLTTGMNLDVCNYMFGSILAMTQSDVYLSMVLSALVLLLFILFYHKMFAITFDETFAKATGIRVGFYKMLLAMLTALTITLGMRLMGTLLISSLIVFPALTAMRLCRSFKWVIIHSIFISVICFFLGLVMSYLVATPPGASVVAMNIVMFFIYSLLSFVRKGVKR
ncbi:metal ABC transporter permease [Turicibacter sanguinis]|uniref:metal ABC transporter permease n=1 Tax=Turicibacter sanguinis TaxID=154288 RepID=UPI0018A98025|nr:metal ABC transporter permease [Turicibacter sanguinis]MDB8544723.1 metal ABC transporter permease [Turicibacter sanguinis]MDB8566341.1 metal ABC transporter permease [Turicibacter sanguinis]MDB8569092.1 metal ABC transporter permease [Turicibacter sanguinis]MDB8571842.1 metal ABC transporter permease [Turicibacter sanguinis]MDB8581416.1 metal ABC transporter permease [Turicibacter sanguinis]